MSRAILRPLTFPMFVVRVRELELPFCSIKLSEEWDIDRINHVTAGENTGFTVGNALRGPGRV